MAPPKRSEALQLDFASLAAPETESEPESELTPELAPEEAPELAVAVPAQSPAPYEGLPLPPPSGDLIDIVARVQRLARSTERAEARLPGSSADDALTVGEFYDRVRGALREEFPGDLWVTGEIRKLSVSRGNRYIELADHHAQASRQGVATIDVSCWSRDWPHVGARLQSVGLQLSAGMVVRIRGRVGVWEGAAKIRFSMIDLDVEALLGGIAAARRRLLAALESEGVLHANRKLAPPLVPLRIGIVTSAGGEAYRDFTGRLASSGYVFDVRLEASLVQGFDAPVQIAVAIRRMHAFKPDLIVLVRGGGAKADLAAFDSEDVARAIATSSYPVWTGVGHTGDESVADEVAQRCCTTPTACAEAVLAAVREYLDGTEARASMIATKGRAALESCAAALNQRRAGLARAARHELDLASGSLLVARNRALNSAVVLTERHCASLSRRAAHVATMSRHSIASADERLTNRRAMLDVFDPQRQLARGWSLTRGDDGRILRSIADASPGERIVTVLPDGHLTSRIETLSVAVPLVGVPRHELSVPTGPGTKDSEENP